MMDFRTSDALAFAELRRTLEQCRAAAANKPALVDLLDQALWIEALWAEQRLGAAVEAVRN